MIWFVIGALSGIVLGLTGAGGAIITVPLLIQFADVTLFQATVYSLMSVSVGAALNWVSQRKTGSFDIALLIALFSIPSSKAFTLVKQQSPEWVVKACFVSLCILSLLSVWRQKGRLKKKMVSAQPARNLWFWVKVSISGILVGAVMTMSGLGGGVVLMPWLMSVLKLPPHEAIATALFPIFAGALVSIGFQYSFISEHFRWEYLIFLSVGSLMAALLVRKIIQKVEQEKMNMIRLWTLAIIILYAIGNFLIQNGG